MNLEDDILIDNYLRGLLDEKAKKDFELRLQSDTPFRENFELEKALWLSQSDHDWSFANQNHAAVTTYKKLLEDENLQDLKKSIQQISSASNTNSSTTRKLSKWYYLAAASIVLCIALSVFLKQDLSHQDLVNEYLQTSDLPSFVSRGDTNADDLIKAQQLFENKNYQGALDLFTPVLETSKPDASVYVYAGIAQMQLQRYQAAESTFNQLIDADLIDAQKGYWYKALLYLKQDKTDDAKQVLNTIISNSYYNHEKAKDLLNEIE